MFRREKWKWCYIDIYRKWYIGCISEMIIFTRRQKIIMFWKVTQNNRRRNRKTAKIHNPEISNSLEKSKWNQKSIEENQKKKREARSEENRRNRRNHPTPHQSRRNHQNEMKKNRLINVKSIEGNRSWSIYLIREIILPHDNRLQNRLEMLWRKWNREKIGRHRPHHTSRNEEKK